MFTQMHLRTGAHAEELLMTMHLRAGTVSMFTQITPFSKAAFSEVDEIVPS